MTNCARQSILSWPPRLEADGLDPPGKHLGAFLPVYGCLDFLYSRFFSLNPFLKLFLISSYRTQNQFLPNWEFVSIGVISYGLIVNAPF